MVFQMLARAKNLCQLSLRTFNFLVGRPCQIGVQLLRSRQLRLRNAQLSRVPVHGGLQLPSSFQFFQSLGCRSPTRHRDSQLFLHRSKGCTRSGPLLLRVCFLVWLSCRGGGSGLHFKTGNSTSRCIQARLQGAGVPSQRREDVSLWPLLCQRGRLLQVLKSGMIFTHFCRGISQRLLHTLGLSLSIMKTVTFAQQFAMQRCYPTVQLLQFQAGELQMGPNRISQHSHRLGRNRTRPALRIQHQVLLVLSD
mmetsp:Transcript_36840/g.88647  ORF Transcript_36840/g.88647 Transcript_36840/m.88647 type:complete len:251 (-) Transcript_36840:211-963(-)